MNNSIILCGFMGCGKSTVGTVLSKRLNRNFTDLDNLIEKTVDMTILQIFKKYGEQYFRDLEHKALEKLLLPTPCIIALGGGTILFKRNLDIIKEKGKIIFLDVPLDTIILRLKDDRTRPILMSGKNVIIKQLYNSRIGVYKSAADVIVNADAEKEEVCKKIIKKLNL